MTPSHAPRSDSSPTTTELAGLARAAASSRPDEAREAFGEIVDQLQRRAVRVAYGYLRDVADADDAVQEAFVRAFTRIADYRPDQAFDPWFLRILVNQCLDRLKARTRRARWMTVDSDAAPAAADRANTAEAELVRTEEAAGLWRAIDELPVRQRTVVVLSQIDGRSPKEIGASIGLRESTVRVHLFRAIRKLRSRLGAPLPQDEKR